MATTTIPFGQNSPVQIPLSLLRAHEAGTVVFFVGAGVSIPAGLPGFRGLVWELYENLLGEKLTEEIIKNSKEVQLVDFRNGHYDRVLDFLDRNALGGRGNSAGDIIRDRTVELLESYSHDAISKTCHKSLVQLASLPDGDRTRLVTTNFDRLFEQAVDELVVDFPKYACTHLGPAGFEHKRNWEGIVYLHGRITSTVDSETGESKTQHNNLILAGADFGRAYIRDGWAARFMERILSGYTVVFVGYGLNDPPLRYMLSALQEEASQTGSIRDRLFTFEGYCSDGINDEQNKIDRSRYWEEVGVQPILYPYKIDCLNCDSEEAKNAKQNHAFLNEALADWALLYTKRVEEGNLRLAKILENPPNHQTPEQFSQILTACYLLGDKGGKVAEHLITNGAKLDVSWLPYFDGRLVSTKEEIEILGNNNSGDQEKKWESELLDTRRKSQISVLMDVAHQVTPGKELTTSQWNIIQWACSRLDSPEIFVHIATYWQPLLRPLRWRIEQAVTGKGEVILSSKLQVCYELLLEGRFEKRRWDNDGLYLVDNPNDTYAEHQIEWVLNNMRTLYTANMVSYFRENGPILSINKVEDYNGRYENKAAELHKWVTDPIQFLRKITRILLQNNDAEQRLRKEGLAYPGASRQLDSISQLDENYDFGSLKSVVSVKMVLDKYLQDEERLDDLWLLVQSWLVEDYHALQALGLYALSRLLQLTVVGHFEVVDYLKRDAGRGLPYLFQPYFVREVEEVLKPFAKTCIDLEATKSLLYSIQTSNLESPEENVYWPFESDEERISVRAIRLKCLRKHGLLLDIESENIISAAEKHSEWVQNYEGYPSGRGLSPLSWSSDPPDNIIFSNAPITDWPNLLQQRGLASNDDWRDVVFKQGKDSVSAIEALLLVSDVNQISGDRWSSIDSVTYQQYVKPDLLARIAVTFSKLSNERIKEIGTTAIIVLRQVLIGAYGNESSPHIELDGIKLADSLALVRESESLRKHSYLVNTVRWRYREIIEYWYHAEYHKQIDAGATMLRIENLLVNLESYPDERAVMLGACLSLSPRLTQVGVNLEEHWLKAMNWENDEWSASLMWQAWAGTGNADISFHHKVWPTLSKAILWLRKKNGYLANQVLNSAAAIAYFHPLNGDFDRRNSLRELLVSLDNKAFGVVLDWLMRRSFVLKKDKSSEEEILELRELFVNELGPFIKDGLPRRVGLVRSTETTTTILRMLVALNQVIFETFPLLLPYISHLPPESGYGNGYSDFRSLGRGLNIDDTKVQTTLIELKKALFIDDVHADAWGWDEVYKYGKENAGDL